MKPLNHMVGQHVVVTNGPPAILGKTGEVLAIADNDCQMLVRVYGVKEPTFDEWPLFMSQVQVLPNAI